MSKFSQALKGLRSRVLPTSSEERVGLFFLGLAVVAWVFAIAFMLPD